MKLFLLLTGLVLIAEPSFAQSAASCGSPEARAFDFWIGDWSIQQRILQQDGTWLSLEAQTSVSPALDGCALIEHRQGTVLFFWEGMREAEPMKALSVRAYDPQTRKWYIHWMDTRTRQFGVPYSGEFGESRGELFREWDTPQGKRMGRITFSDIARDTVNWALAISSDQGKSWSTLWTMAMSRTSK